MHVAYKHGFSADACKRWDIRNVCCAALTCSCLHRLAGFDKGLVNSDAEGAGDRGMFEGYRVLLSNKIL